jgi:GNAT superfamily N-acetyltransferase
VRPGQPRPIRPDDPVSGFDCGDDALNSWLAHRAWRNEAAGDSRTYVSVDLDGGAVCGFYSLAAGSVSRAAAGAGWLARNAPDPVPVVLLGRLAVSTDAQGLGLGRDLVADALAKASQAQDVLGARALMAEAINPRAEQFYSHLGFWRSRSRPDLFAIKLTHR